jgi:hypothetical protein
MDPESNELLLVLPDHLDWAPHAKKGVVVRIGWPDHAAWHESLAHFSAAMPARSPFLRLVVGGVPVHHERRRHLRVPMTRKVQVLSRGQALLATTINVSEAAMRTVLPVHNSPCSGDAVTVTLRLTSRHTEEVRTVAFDGRILRSAELSGARAGSKEIVVLYATATPAQEDAVRGLVFELGLQERIAQEAEGSLVGP